MGVPAVLNHNAPRTAALAWLSARREKLGLAVCLVLLTLAVYLQVGRFGLIPIDDNLYVTKEPHIRDGLSAGGVVWDLGPPRQLADGHIHRVAHRRD